ncbi:MAG: hypothetical protein VKJ05_06155 [Synechococcaceae cyanobacterium]|nr:hypothetical protein [Synechococcaceae cyanobacterium]
MIAPPEPGPRLGGMRRLLEPFFLAPPLAPLGLALLVLAWLVIVAALTLLLASAGCWPPPP